MHWFKRLNQLANKHEWVMLLLTMMIALRLPGLVEPYWYGDENIYLAIGQAMSQGAVLYQDIFDFPSKPPLIYLISALVQTLAGLRFVALLWQVVAVLAFYRIAWLISANKTTTYFATMAYVFLANTPILEGHIANAEDFFVPATLLSMSLVLPLLLKQSESKLRGCQLVLVGAIWGLALMFKLHPVFDLMALGLLLWWAGPSLTDKLKAANWLGQIGLGLLLSWLGLLLLMLWWGVTPQLLSAQLFAGGAYLNTWIHDGSFIASLLATWQLRLMWALFYVLTLFVLRSRLHKTTLVVLVWLAFAWAGALMSGRPYPHYLLQALPAFVLAASLLFTTIDHFNRVVVVSSLALVLLSLVTLGFGVYPVKSYYQDHLLALTGQISKQEHYGRLDKRTPANYQAAEVIRSITSASDRIFVWADQPDLYLISDRQPIGPVVTAFHVTDLKLESEIIERINQQKPRVIVWAEPVADFPQLRQVLALEYQLYQLVSGPASGKSQVRPIQVFRRASPM